MKESDLIQPGRTRSGQRNWRSLSLHVCSLVFAQVLAVFALIDLFTGEIAWAIAAAASVPFCLASAWGSRGGGDGPPGWAPWPLAICLLGLFTVLPWIGESPVRGAVIMWYCAAPPILVLTVGARYGVMLSIALFGLLLASLATVAHGLPPAYALRYCIGYLSITTIMGFTEWLRERDARRLAQQDAELRQLKGLLSVCGWCHKRIRDDNGVWIAMERYLQERAPVQVSHGICPVCEAEMARELDARSRRG